MELDTRMTMQSDQPKPKHTQLTARRTLDTSNLVVAVLLALVLAVGGYFRFVGLNWDDYTHLHPDERFLTQ
ncbi:MAG: hypothetical protein AAF125_25545, partial [Chloroflexota bacterium]